MTTINTLKEEQKSRDGDSFIIDYDYINDDGDKIQDDSHTHPEFGEVEDKTNVTNLYQTSLSTTTDVFILVTEAILYDEGRIDESSNPHIPATMEILERAEDRIYSNELVPAWTVFEETPSGQPSEGEAMS